MNPTLETCAAALRRNRFDVRVVATSEEALAAMKTIVEAERPEIVSFGDSMTMRATGVIEWLRGERRFRLLDGFDPSSGSKYVGKPCCATCSSRGSTP